MSLACVRLTETLSGIDVLLRLRQRRPRRLRVYRTHRNSQNGVIRVGLGERGGCTCVSVFTQTRPKLSSPRVSQQVKEYRVFLTRPCMRKELTWSAPCGGHMAGKNRQLGKDLRED